MFQKESGVRVIRRKVGDQRQSNWELLDLSCLWLRKLSLFGWAKKHTQGEKTMEKRGSEIHEGDDIHGTTLCIFSVVRYVFGKTLRVDVYWWGHNILRTL